MRYLLILLFALLTACNSSVPTLKPYKMDIQQGNVVTSKMLLQLRPGMTKSQVRYIMGTPLIVDSFHNARWDYFFQLRQKGEIVEQRRVILEFENDKLARVRGDVVPSGSESATAGKVEDKKNVVVNVEPKPKEEKSWADKLKFWKNDAPAKADAPKLVQQQVTKENKVTVETPKEESSWTEKLKFWKSEDSSKKAVESTNPVKEVKPEEVPVPSVPEVVVPAAIAVPEATVEPAEMDVKPIEFPMVKEEPASAPQAVQVSPAQPVQPAEAAPLKATPEVPSIAVPPAVVVPNEPIANSKGDWRIDRTLRSYQPEVEKLAEPVKRSGTKVAPTPPPPEEDATPGYFERILEKIGF